MNPLYMCWIAFWLGVACGAVGFFLCLVFWAAHRERKRLAIERRLMVHEFRNKE